VVILPTQRRSSEAPLPVPVQAAGTLQRPTSTTARSRSTCPASGISLQPGFWLTRWTSIRSAPPRSGPLCKGTAPTTSISRFWTASFGLCAVSDQNGLHMTADRAARPSREVTISAHLGAWVAPHPSELPDLRIQMCEQVLQPPHSREFMMRVVGGSSPLIPTISGPPDETAGIDIMGGILMARSEQRRLREAQLYWVDEDMTSLALAAAATPSHEPVQARRMPAEAGLMLFAHPIGSHDVDLAAALTSPWTTAAPDLDEELRLTFPVLGVSWSRWSPADLDLDGAPGRISWTPRTPQGAAPLTPEFDGVWLTFWTTGSKGWDSLPWTGLWHHRTCGSRMRCPVSLRSGSTHTAGSTRYHQVLGHPASPPRAVPCAPTCSVSPRAGGPVPPQQCGW
jgi:hypothetical protein